MESTTQRTPEEIKAAKKAQNKGLAKMVAIVIGGMAAFYLFIIWATDSF